MPDRYSLKRWGLDRMRQRRPCITSMYICGCLHMQSGYHRPYLRGSLM